MWYDVFDRNSVMNMEHSCPSSDVEEQKEYQAKEEAHEEETSQEAAHKDEPDSLSTYLKYIVIFMLLFFLLLLVSWYLFGYHL
jgi:hypothetical protein